MKLSGYSKIGMATLGVWIAHVQGQHYPLAALLGDFHTKMLDKLYTKALQGSISSSSGATFAPPPPPPPPGAHQHGTTAGAFSLNAPPSPPQPQASGSLSSRTGTSGVSQQPAAGGIDDLLASIRGGTALKKASERQLKPIQEEQKSLFDSLVGAVTGRRSAIEGNDDEESSGWDDEDWGSTPSKPTLPTQVTIPQATTREDVKISTAGPVAVPVRTPEIEIKSPESAKPVASGVPAPTSSKPVLPPKPTTPAKPPVPAKPKPKQVSSPKALVGLKFDDIPADYAKLESYFDDVEAFYDQFLTKSDQIKATTKKSLETLAAALRSFQDTFGDLMDDAIEQKFNALCERVKNFRNKNVPELRNLPVIDAAPKK